MNSKKLICLLCAFVTLVCIFTACSNSKDKEEETTTEFQVTEDSLYTTDPNASTTDASKVVFYDRYGKTYSDLNELPYYAENGKIYYYSKSSGKACFKDTDGNIYDVNKCFINPKGYFVYDEEGKITLDDSSLSAKDKDGIIYFPAVTIRWTKDNKMSLAFGFGKEIEMLDDDMELN